jgi:hypothetical protein
VGASLATQRYQQLVVLALVGAHAAGSSNEADLLEELAKDAPAGLPPSPSYVLGALIEELTARGLSDAERIARQLLPGVDLPI